jgi:MFS family permease
VKRVVSTGGHASVLYRWFRRVRSSSRARTPFGIIPTYAQIGLAAAVILFVLRLIQGLCLGGEYGGAITYAAEHISA